MNLSLLMTKPKQISYVAETGCYQTHCLMVKQFLLHRHATLGEERCQFLRPRLQQPLHKLVKGLQLACT